MTADLSRANRPLDVAALRRAHPLQIIAGTMIKLERVGGEWRGCCPFHADRTPSFTIYDGGERFQCFGCGASGDVLDFVQRVHGVGFRDAAELLGAGTLPSVHLAAPEVKDDEQRIADALAVWRSAEPVRGTLGETYLRSRGLHLSLPESLRFASLPYGKGARTYTVLIAAVASADDRLTGIQRTYLDPSGTGKADVPKPKLSLGKVAGGAIRLTPCARNLLVTEGLEDGLTLLQELGQAVWVACGASMLPRMVLPAGVGSVAIGGDNDDAGRRAATMAAEAFRHRGIVTRVFFPLDAKDFNQELMERTSA